MVGTPSRNGGGDQPGIVEYMAKVGARDLLTIVASDASGVGVLINVHLRSTFVLDRTASATFSQLAMHIASASQLRESEGADDVAVFRRDGTLVHADPDVREAAAITPLRDVVRAMTRLQTDRAGAAPLAKVTSRVEAQWTVVAHFSDKSDEFVVARRNAAPVLAVPGMEKLTPRECEVVSFLALGHSQKAIAYELGIAPSPVRVLIARARVTLGVKDTSELLRRITGM
jgi:DNA-binding CsgD family transcriptional regulator